MLVRIKLYEKADGKTLCTEFECDEGAALGKNLRRLMKCPPGSLFSMDIQGHVQVEDGPIEDTDAVYIRKDREFMKILK
jgi:hypothetical protein